MTPEWSTACPDWEKRIAERRSLIPFSPLFPDQAFEARKRFCSLRIVDAPGSPLIGDVSREWLLGFNDAVFGSYDAEAGRRLIRDYFLLISKKNAKSTGAAGIMLTALTMNWRMSAEFLILAPTIEIANNSFYPARDMVKADPELSELMHVQEHIRTITYRPTNATLKVVAADNETVGGKKAVGVLVDELWLFGKRANAENMLREATGGLASRPEGFTIYLSTQADDPPAGVFRQKLQYARGVRDGRINDKRFLPVLYEFPAKMLEEGAAKDPSFFYITNPNLGASVDREFLDREFSIAQENGDDSMRGFLAKHLNVEIGISLRSDRWPGAEFWASREDAALTKEELFRRCDAVVVGIDGGGLDDLFGMAVLGRDSRSNDWLCWSHSWCHESVLTRRRSIVTKLLDFERAGELTILRGEDISDVTGILEVIEEAMTLGSLACVAVDPAGLGELVDALDEIGVNEAAKNLVGVGQGYRMMTALKTAERRLAKGTLLHGKNGLLDWAISNLKIEPTATAVRATKQNAGDAKIDPAMALFNAVTVMMTNPEGNGAMSGFLSAPVMSA